MIKAVRKRRAPRRGRGLPAQRASLRLPSGLGDDHLVGQLFELRPQLRVVQRQFNIPLGRVALLAALLELALHGAEEMLQPLVGVGRSHISPQKKARVYRVRTVRSKRRRVLTETAHWARRKTAAGFGDQAQAITAFSEPPGLIL